MATFGEQAEQLRAIASSENIPIGVLLSAQQQLDQVSGQVTGLIDSSSEHYNNVIGMCSAARDAVGNAIAALKQMETAIHDAADHHSR